MTDDDGIIRIDQARRRLKPPPPRAGGMRAHHTSGRIVIEYVTPDGHVLESYFAEAQAQKFCGQLERAIADYWKAYPHGTGDR